MTSPSFKKPEPLPPFQIVRAQTIPPAESVSLLLYGPPGAGKTHFAATAGDRTLYINCGRSEETLLSAHFKKKVGANPLLVNIRETMGENGIPEKATAFDQVCDAIDYGLQHYGDQFDTVVVDDVTFLRKYAMFKGLEVNSDLKKSKTLGEVRKYNMLLTSVQDFQAEMSLIEQFVVNYGDTLKSLKKNFILIAHERLTYRKGEKIGDAPSLVKCGPGFTGQTFPDQIPAYFDWVFHAETVLANNSVTYRIRTVGDDILVGKCRHGDILKTLEINPNFLELVDRVRKSRTVTNAN